MSELICCRRCDEPTCCGCNLYTLANALTLGRFDGLMDEHHAVHINADVVDRDEGIKIGAALAAMHGSDATSQDLARAYFEGMEEGYKKGHSGFEKRAMWITTRTIAHDGNWYCSLCDYEPYYSRDIHTLKYCPNCGAKMEE